MTRPRTAGDLLSQRPHTTLPADEDAAEEDDEGDDEPDYAPTGYAHADEELGSLLADARSAELDLPNYQRFWERLRGNVVGAAQTMWQLHGPNPDGAYHAGNIVTSGQQVGSRLTQLYAKDALDVDFTPFDPGPGIIERPGIDKVQEYLRPAREDSVKAQLRRLETLANTDLQLSKTRTLFSAFDEDQTVNRAPIRIYKRVTTSEKPCALCEIAADQVYFTTDLMPIHDNCMCDVEMSDAEDIDEHKARYHHIGFVDSLIDAGEQVKALTSLADADADADEYMNLIKIEQHGELGPVIRWSGQKFTGPRDLPVPRGIRPVPTISGPGLGHEARLQSNAARVAQIRRQRSHLDMRYAPGHGGITTFVPTPKVARPIPRKPPVVTELRPAKPKAIDFQHDSAADIVDALETKHADQVGRFGDEWKDPQYNEDTKRAVLQALDEMLTKYPEVHINQVLIEDAKGDWAGLTGYNRLTKGADYIKFDAGVMRMSPEQMRAAWSRFHDRFHFPGAASDPARYLVYHEFGHALDSSGGFAARDTAEKTVSNLFTRTGGWQEITPDMTPGKINKTILDNEDRMRKWMGQQLSGYSMVDGYLPDQINPDTGRLGRMGLSKGEALAQAFADAEMRGDKATDVSQAFHRQMVEASKGTPEHRYGQPRVAATPKSAVDKLSELTAPKPNWTEADIRKEDNFSRNKAGEVILSDEQRAYARQLATEIWVAGARVEPAISAAARSSTESLGGFMSGWDFRQKTGPSLYRKIQAEAIDIAKGEPITNEILEKAANGIKDAVRYTAVMPEDGYWAKGDDLRKALEQLGAKTIKDPVGVPLHGYRGRNMAFTLNGTPFEMQVHTELGVAIKDEAHKIYNTSRVLEADLKAKGLDPEQDPTYQKLMHEMQAKWDTMPMLKGTPLVQTEKDAKSGDLSKVMYTMDHSDYRGETVPGGRADLGSTEMLRRERVPSTAYGLDWLPDSPEPKIVAPARMLGDDIWDSLPIQHLPPGTHIKANEGTLKKKSIDSVVGGKVPFREGYIIKLYRTDDGLLHVVDGHTRIAMYNALGKDMPVRIIDQRTLDQALAKTRFGELYQQNWPFEPARTPLPDLHPVTGLSADKKGWGSVAKRMPDGTEIKPVYTTTKSGKKQLDVAATWAKVSDETLRQNWRLALRQSKPWAQKAGADWYPGVHRLAERLTAKYKDTFEKRWGIKLTPELTASFFAAYSENNGWDGNLVGVRRLLDGTGTEYAGELKDFKYEEASDYKGIKAGKYGIKYVIPADEPSASQLAKLKEGKRIPQFQIPGYKGWYRLYDFHVNKALRAMQNPRGGIADLRENDATAPKPADFGANIAGDYSRATADRWVARIILHTDDGDFAESMRGFTKTKNKVPNRIGYQRMSQALQEVAREPEFAHLNAAAVQAIPWIDVVGPLGSIGEIDDLTSYASVKAETLRKAAEFGDVE